MQKNVSRMGGCAHCMGSNEEEYISGSVEPAPGRFYGEAHIKVVPNLLNDRKWSRDTGGSYSDGIENGTNEHKHRSCRSDVRRHDLAATRELKCICHTHRTTWKILLG